MALQCAILGLTSSPKEAQMAEQSIVVLLENGEYRLALYRHIDRTAAAPVRQKMDAFLESDFALIVFDLGQTDTIDGPGVEALGRACARALEAGRQVRIANLHPRLRRQLEKTNIAAHLTPL
ncbi:MAG: hypothetical protein A3J48_01855 [Candidatus Doudnabacteria bacterium RIFCSPHIGHO2_02_FULL_46_11]|uniref:STAS domain-containing protein n=1 Tax=Candidatus Doudnabacteria bacterium RIFCSPHIGHO2_02_FULL_46_11 TaxID=1817832 RepID=A0A1F5P9Y2_9BACT|nr:MAG: hypothetical protein A3J48_01855 [Candidatus Doudnabacteria bacterium RIFCSPHIGHO2_02_FULL_46_11]